MQRKPLPGLVSLRIDRRASQTIGGKEPGRRPSDPKSGSVLFGRICFRFREHDLIRSLIGFRHSSRSGVDSPSEQIEQIDDGNGVERFKDRKAHRTVSLRFDFDFRIRKSPLYSRFIGESVHLVFFAVDSQCRRFNGNVRIERDLGPRTAKNRGARREQDNGRYIQRKTSSRTPIFSAAKIPSILLKLGTHHFGVQHGHLRIESVPRKFRASAPAFPTPRNRPHRKEPERPSGRQATARHRKKERPCDFRPARRSPVRRKNNRREPPLRSPAPPKPSAAYSPRSPPDVASPPFGEASLRPDCISRIRSSQGEEGRVVFSSGKTAPRSFFFFERRAATTTIISVIRVSIVRYS